MVTGASLLRAARHGHQSRSPLPGLPSQAAPALRHRGRITTTTHTSSDRTELLAGDRAGRPPAGGALVARRARHPERATDELDGEASRLLRLNEGAHLRGVPSSSLAKNTDAALRISLA